MEGSELGDHLRGRRRIGENATEFGYGSSWGFAPLRERLAVTLGDRSIRCGPDQILLTHGANHAMDLIVRCFVEPGDAVFVDDPRYYPLFGKLKLAKAQVVGIRCNMDGPDLQAVTTSPLQRCPSLRPRDPQPGRRDLQQAERPQIRTMWLALGLSAPGWVVRHRDVRIAGCRDLHLWR